MRDCQGCDNIPEYIDDWDNLVCEDCKDNELENNREARQEDYEEMTTRQIANYMDG